MQPKLIYKFYETSQKYIHLYLIFKIPKFIQ